MNMSEHGFGLTHNMNNLATIALGISFHLFLKDPKPSRQPYTSSLNKDCLENVKNVMISS